MVATFRKFDERLRATPTDPGVYLMRDASGTILYVGKAASLKHRLSSYFAGPSALPPKIRRMVQKVADFEFIVTESEAEALILENTFIKSQRPKYNARLKDDKTYPYLKIDLNEEFPRVYITRQVANDGARYFGPFATASSVRQTMDLVKKLFPYRSCTKVITGTDPRPCLEYFIHRCVAPCSGYATRDDYAEVIEQVILFMEGNTEVVTRDLREGEARLGDLRFTAIDTAGLEDADPDSMEGRMQRQTETALDDADLAIIDKRRPKANVSQVMHIIGEVEGRTCVLVDDMVDTAGTLCKAAQALKDHGASKVYAYITHPVLSGPAIDNIASSSLDQLVVTDTIPLSEAGRACDKIRVLSLAPMLAETVRRVNNEESLSAMFDRLELV